MKSSHREEILGHDSAEFARRFVYSDALQNVEICRSAPMRQPAAAPAPERSLLPGRPTLPERLPGRPSEPGTAQPLCLHHVISFLRVNTRLR